MHHALTGANKFLLEPISNNNHIYKLTIKENTVYLVECI